MTFKWVKGHDKDYGNIKANALANKGRVSDLIMRVDDKNWVGSHAALQDGARLQALKANHIYSAILKWHSKSNILHKHQEAIDEAKDRVEETTGL